MLTQRHPDEHFVTLQRCGPHGEVSVPRGTVSSHRGICCGNFRNWITRPQGAAWGSQTEGENICGQLPTPVEQSRVLPPGMFMHPPTLLTTINARNEWVIGGRAYDNTRLANARGKPQMYTKNRQMSVSLRRRPSLDIIVKNLSKFVFPSFSTFESHPQSWPT